MAGGGFNTRNATLRSGPLAPMLSTGGQVEDVEGVGRTLRGGDNRLYYTDSDPTVTSGSAVATVTAASSPAGATATARKIDLLPRHETKDRG